MNNYIILQARTGSTRFNNKVLSKIGNKKVIEIIIQEIKKVDNIDKIFIATTNNIEDDILENICNENNVNCYRGEVKDVFSRYKNIAKKYFFPEDNIVRLTGDNPLIKREIIEQVMDCHIKNDNFYTSNIIERSWPRGMDVEILKSKFFINDGSLSFNKDDLEHVTLFIRKNLQLYKTENVHSRKKDFMPNLRLCIDYKEDLYFINHLVEKLGLDASIDKIIKYIKKNPNVLNTVNTLKQTMIDGKEW